MDEKTYAIKRKHKKAGVAILISDWNSILKDMLLDRRREGECFIMTKGTMHQGS